MKPTLQLLAVMLFLSTTYVVAQPAENTRIDLTKQVGINTEMPPALSVSTYYNNKKKHCQGWYVGEYIMAGGAALALAGGAMWLNYGTNSNNDNQPPAIICFSGIAIFSVGVEVFAASWKYEHGWRSWFIVKSDRNRFGIAYKF